MNEEIEVQRGKQMLEEKHKVISPFLLNMHLFTF